MHHILITGSSGFIGQNLVNYWVNNPSYIIHLYDVKTHSYYDLVDTFQNHEIETVIHLGAISNTNASMEEVQMYNIAMTECLFSLCIKYRVKRVLYASSAAVYGNPETSRPFEETDPIPYTKLAPYAISKAMNEVDAQRLIDSGITAIGMRFFNVYSEKGETESHKDQPSPHYSFRKQAMKEGKITLFVAKNSKEEARRDFISIDRVLYYIDRLMRYKSGVYNVGSGMTKTFREIAEETAIEYNCYVEPLEKKFPITYQRYTRANTNKLRNTFMRNTNV
jgi:nucleoside-diphosphate-sugar epimerase